MKKLIKKLIRSLYFLVKHHILHTTMFEGLITLQIENGDVKLKNHRENCPRNAMYESYATVVDLASISKVLESNILSSFQASTYFSLMADQSTDISSKEELYVHDGYIIANQWSIFLALYQQRRQLLKLLLFICACS